MKRCLTAALSLLLCLQVQALADDPGWFCDSLPQKTALDWGVSLSYLFDNSEYSRSSDSYDASGTLHGVRLSPSIGIAVPQDDNVLHRVRIGVDLQKLAGENLPAGDVFKEFQLYYDAFVLLGSDSRFEALAGCFPRAEFDGSYIGPVFDRAVPFRDSNVDGVLFKYGGGRFRAELGLDWLGMFADTSQPERRERFQILTSGDWNFAGPFHFLWTGMFYHYACSLKASNVVDNHQITPMLEWRPSCWLDRATVSAGAILTYQYDRDYEDRPATPAGLWSVQEIGKWNVRLTNKFYCGKDLQVYYDKYGSELYPGSQMFRTRTGGTSVSDEFILSYNPRITDWLDLGVYAIFSFGSPNPALGTGACRGCRQFVSLRLNLEKFRKFQSSPSAF